MDTKDHPERHNPASVLTCLRMTKKDRPVVAPFTIAEAESLISRLHADWGEAIGNCDEFRFFTGLRPSEQIALLVSDYDVRRVVLSVTKARVLRLDKERTKTLEDRDVELRPRAVKVLRRHLALRDEYVAAGRIRHQHLFFLEDGRPISDSEITRWRWVYAGAGPTTRVEVLLRMYAAWLDGATDVDIQLIKQAMERRPVPRMEIPDSRAAISAVNAAAHRAKFIVILPLESPEFGSSLAVGKSGTGLSTGKDLEKNWRRGWDSNPRRA